MVALSNEDVARGVITYCKAHRYSNTVLALIHKMPSTIWLLDAGGGSRKISLANYVNADIQRNTGSTDVLCDIHNLPLRDNSFDLVINEAVLEHVKRPWVVVKELERVLRRGGYLYVKVAFMQPVHNYPAHYFNMTKEGLLSLFADMTDFRIVQSGVEEDQMPSYTLMFVLSNYLRALFPQVSEKMGDVEIFEKRLFGERNQLAKIIISFYLGLLNLLKVLDRKIDSEHAEKLAAGFFLLGMKV